MKALENFGYQCRLEKTTAPWSQEYTEVYDSGVKLEQPVSYQFTIGGDSWKLQAMPNKGWENNSLPLIALCSIALGKSVVSNLAVLGDITISGTMIKVDELANTLQVCLDSGAKKVLIPSTSFVDFASVPADLMSAFQLIPYQSAEDAVFKALGVE